MSNPTLLHQSLPLLQAVDLAYGYTAETVLFQQIAFTLNPGELLHIQGDNGVGKSTLMRVLLGILSPKRGTVCYEGQPIQNQSAAYHQQIAYLDHRLGHHRCLTVEEVVAYDLEPTAVRDFEMLLTVFQLQALRTTRLVHLSAGQQRRLSLIRVLSSKARIWFLDEPLVHLDAQSRQLFFQRLEMHLQAFGMAIIISHQTLPIDKPFVVKRLRW